MLAVFICAAYHIYVCVLYMHLEREHGSINPYIIPAYNLHTHVSHSSPLIKGLAGVLVTVPVDVVADSLTRGEGMPETV